MIYTTYFRNQPLIWRQNLLTGLPIARKGEELKKATGDEGSDKLQSHPPPLASFLRHLAEVRSGVRRLVTTVDSDDQNLVRVSHGAYLRVHVYLSRQTYILQRHGIRADGWSNSLYPVFVR